MTRGPQAAGRQHRSDEPIPRAARPGRASARGAGPNGARGPTHPTAYGRGPAIGLRGLEAARPADRMRGPTGAPVPAYPAQLVATLAITAPVVTGWSARATTSKILRSEFSSEFAT